MRLLVRVLEEVCRGRGFSVLICISCLVAWDGTGQVLGHSAWGQTMHGL